MEKKKKFPTTLCVTKKKETTDTHGKCCVKLRFLRRLRAEGVNPWPSDAERQEVCTDILLSIVYLMLFYTFFNLIANTEHIRGIVCCIMAFVILEKCFLRFGVDKNGREKLQNIQNPRN